MTSHRYYLHEMDGPLRWDKAERGTAAHIERENPRWHVEWGVGSHRFHAYPLFAVPHGTWASSPGEEDLLAQMRLIEWHSGAARERGAPLLTPVEAGEPHERLRAEREKHCLSRPQLARLLARHVMDQCPDEDSLVSNIKRWERGTCGVSERYRSAFSVVFGVDEGQLFGQGPRPPVVMVPNVLLRGVREQERVETQAEFVAAIERKARELGERIVPPERYIRRLETGYITWPHPACGRLLSALCERPLSELGFTRPSRVRPHTGNGQSGQRTARSHEDGGARRPPRTVVARDTEGGRGHTGSLAPSPVLPLASGAHPPADDHQCGQ